MRVQSFLVSVATPFCLVTLASPILAQGSIVIPPGTATAEGNSADIEPFGFDQVRHIQYVHQSMLPGLAANTLIKEIAYRRDGNVTSPATLVRYRTIATKVKPVWQVRLGNLPNTTNIMAPPADFPATTLTNWTTVFPATQFDFPDLPLTNGAGNPQNFDIKFPLPAVFQFTGPHLGIDHFAYEANSPTWTYYVDAVDGGPPGGSADLITPTSVGCPAGQNRAYGSSANPGAGDLVFTLFGAEPNRTAFACLGASASQWGPYALPLDLTTLLLLPGCKVYTDLLYVTGRGTGLAGAAEFRAPIPANPALVNAVLYGQWVNQDSRVNPLVGLATSDGLKFKLGGSVQPQMSIVSAIQFLAQGRSGLIQPGRGAVVQVSW